MPSIVRKGKTPFQQLKGPRVNRNSYSNAFFLNSLEPNYLNISFSKIIVGKFYTFSGIFSRRMWLQKTLTLTGTSHLLFWQIHHICYYSDRYIHHIYYYYLLWRLHIIYSDRYRTLVITLTGTSHIITRTGTSHL